MGTCLLPSAPLPVWNKDVIPEVQQLSSPQEDECRRERWQKGKKGRRLCPQWYLLSHHTDPKLLTSRPVIIWRWWWRGSLTCVNHWPQGSVTCTKRLLEGEFPIMVRLLYSHKNLSSKILLTLNDPKWTLICFIS